ncbi:MAG: hypothetical protein Q9201_001205 [Fulgogasparrea decipioides]
MSIPWAHDGHIRSFFTATPGAANSLATSVDEDGSRRKRRRTDSPKPQPAAQGPHASQSRDEQLRAAASNEPSLSQSKATTAGITKSSILNETSIVATSAPSTNSEAQNRKPFSEVVHDDLLPASTASSQQKPKRKRKQREKKAKDPSVVLSDSAVALKRHAHASVNGATAERALASSTKPPLDQTLPPRKMIEVRPDGTLSSPKRMQQRLSTSKDDSRTSVIKTNEHGGPRKMIKVRADGKLASSKAHDDNAPLLVALPADTTAIQDTLPPAVGTLKAETPPKKLMKIRSDGKLASPSSQAAAECAQSKRRGRTKRQVNDIKQRIVILKYGKTDRTRLATGQRVQEILSEPSNPLGSEAKYESIRKSSEPPKATHPFFLGKLAHKPRADVIALEAEKVEPPPDTGSGSGCVSSLAKTRSPSRPNVTMDTSSWASVSAFGRSPLHSFHSEARSFRGMKDPIWPPQGMIHVRPEVDIQPGVLSTLPHNSPRTFTPSSVLKLKLVESKIAEFEEVLNHHALLVNAWKSTKDELEHDYFQRDVLRVPTRRVMTGRDLQKTYCERHNVQPFARNRFEDPEPEKIDELSAEYYRNRHTHPALSLLYDRIATSRSAFDRFECEIHDWAHKYAPKEAREILQPGREALIFRDWLRSLAVNSIDDGSHATGQTHDTTKDLKKLHVVLQKKRRKRAEKLDGFVVSGDEEANEMDELKDETRMDTSQPQDSRNKKSEVRARETANLSINSGEGEKFSNAVVISGPCGCGKTAAVYAAGQELGFEVFEINSGNRRSGKDILDRVGDMTRNHLVNQTRPTEVENVGVPVVDPSHVTEALRPDMEPGRQSTMNAFLQPKKGKKSPKKQKQPKQEVAAAKKPKRTMQKQSIILLEEVDVLFEEDKQFWATTMGLIMQSRRPVIMTCTDESLLPLDDLPLFGILRFTQPPEQLAIEYLLLLACNEGHLLSREAVSALYKANCNDLRASITQLQFFCQMGVGDTKGGLEWMPIPSSSIEKEALRDKRVVSEGTYLKGMGWVSREQRILAPEQPTNEIELVSSVCNDWRIDLADQDGFLPSTAATLSPSADRVNNLQKLKTFDLVQDALSLSGNLQYSCFQGDFTAPLDVSTPKMSEKDRINYVEGYSLLQTDLLQDPTGLSDSIAATLRVFARRVFLSSPGNPHQSVSLDEQLIENFPDLVQARHRPGPVTHNTLSTAFEPLAKSSTLSMLALKGPFISALDSPIPTIVEDVAPYVRSIVSYDLHLEAQRRQLELTASGGRNGSGKRTRTTRASRAALEGGSKANTRRERWFPDSTNFEAVLETGGEGWQEEAQRRTQIAGSEGVEEIGTTSHRSSVGSLETEVVKP